MKHMIQSLLVLFCFLLTFGAEAQQRKGKEPQRRETQTQQHTEQPARRATIKDYKPGESYVLGDTIDLKNGTKLTLELVKPDEAIQVKTIRLKLKFSAEVQILHFTQGEPERSDITLMAIQQRINPTEISFLRRELVSDKPIVGAWMEGYATKDNRVGYLGLTAPLLLEFNIPDELSKSPKRLELRNIGIGKEEYSLTLMLDK